MKPAIIIIDVLQDFFREGRLNKHRKKIVANINEMTNFGRLNRIPVIWVRQEFKADLSDAFLAYRENNYRITIKGTPGCQLLPELVVDSTDYEIVKKRYSAFFKTNLDSLLNKMNADTLIIGGVNTHACIRTAAIDAYQRDYKVILAVDCIDSYDKVHHEISLKYLSRSIAAIMNNRMIIQKLSRKGK